jgi:1-deoxy-D-xylulose-5-phosphate reductoisomerase
MKKLSILGSTGSIGCNVLEVVSRFPERFRIMALAAKRNVSRLADQIRLFRPDIAVVIDEAAAAELQSRLSLGRRPQVLFGEEGYRRAAAYEPVDTTVTAVVGAAGLKPTLEAIRAGKRIALANKETLVMAGSIVMPLAAANHAQILPIDSEHSAIFQCLKGNRRRDLAKILLTASGGPFRDRPARSFADITPREALEHPNWSMGAKISIDSATMMNKGLEVIEAMWLFGVKPDDVRVVVHPQSIIHSMVAFKDGSVLAQLGVPDMKTAIAYALSYPERLPLAQPLPDFAGRIDFTFREPDEQKFPCLRLAYQAAKAGGTLPAVLNAANETAVDLFLQQHIRFSQIPPMVEEAMRRHAPEAQPALDDILKADLWARDAVMEIWQQGKG